MKKKRVFTVEQKMQILREAEEHGMLATCPLESFKDTNFTST